MPYRLLYAATYVFLALPYPLFFAGWLRAPYAALASLLVIAAAFVGIRRAFQVAPTLDESAASSGRALWRALWPVLPIVSIAGFGGLGNQDWDWLRGNAVFLDLVSKPWPVAYGNEREPVLLIYYVAFYLPPAAVGKLLGWGAANVAMLLWASFGLCLAASWVCRLVGAGRWWTSAVFLAFSGMDALGMTLRLLGELASGAAHHQTWSSMEWWSGYGTFCFPAHLELLVLAPNQAIPAWLLTALLLDDWRRQRVLGTGVFYLGLCTLWAPYVAIGLLPFVLVAALPALIRRRGLSELWTLGNAAGAMLGLLLVVYFAARYGSYTMPIALPELHEERLTLTPLRMGRSFFAIYPMFLVLEFGLLHALLYFLMRRGVLVLDEALRRLLLASTAVLCFLPWINLSWNNDIVMRASVPMLMVTALCAILALGSMAAAAQRRERLARAAVVVVLALGWINVGNVARRQIGGTLERGAWFAVPEPSQVQDLFELQTGRYDRIGYDFVRQYLGSVATPFGRWLMKSVEP